MIFYDTCSLLSELNNAFKEKFLVSVITFKELENIKTSYNKDYDIKFAARKLIRLLVENEDKYEVIPFDLEDKLAAYGLDPTNDNRIILTAYYETINRPNDKIIFYTQDLCCYAIAKNLAKDTNFTVIYDKQDNEEVYSGYKEVEMSLIEMAEFYQNIYKPEYNPYNLYINQYLIINNETADYKKEGYIYKFTEEGHIPVRADKFKSDMFGVFLPKDEYQICAMDSLKTNQLTVIRGRAGSGKSMMGLAYLFNLLERNKIDKIVMFVNPVATRDSCKFGFLPGTFLEKVLGSQIGNFLSSKLGGIEMVYQLIDQHKLEFIAMADARGYDTTNMHCGIYCTESQNMSIEMMKLLLSRIGDDTVCVLEGDNLMQTDLVSYEGPNNGLNRVCEIYQNEDYFGTVTLQNCYRSRIAAKIEEM